jgi:hypothetical protein
LTHFGEGEKIFEIKRQKRGKMRFLTGFFKQEVEEGFLPRPELRLDSNPRPEMSVLTILPPLPPPETCGLTMRSQSHRQQLSMPKYSKQANTKEC